MSNTINCRGCEEPVSAWDTIRGFCPSCLSSFIDITDGQAEKIERLKEYINRLESAIHRGDWLALSVIMEQAKKDEQAATPQKGE